jgi:hypothetical protein
MIQFETSVSTPTNSLMRLDLWNNMIQDGTETTIKPLISFTSQLTGKSKIFLPFYAIYTWKERYVLILLTLKNADNLYVGDIKLGTTDFPYGLYDVNIYQNQTSSPANLDPANAIKKIYTGLMNLTAKAGNEAIDYTEYTTNDSETESVYITF